VCGSCGTAFGCGAKLDGCWCTGIELKDWQAELIKARYDDCLCPVCLALFSKKAAMKVIYSDGSSAIVEDAVRVDTQNFHEGMYDFYDERGNLLEQIDMGSGVSWESI
jgi:hypothetical protein